jgi:hypothetical protein
VQWVMLAVDRSGTDRHDGDELGAFSDLTQDL